MNWKQFVYQGVVYDLSHLHPRSITYTQSAKDGKPERCYNVDVIFSLHCFTREPGVNEAPAANLLYSDDRETRVFDFRRYALSIRLPEIVARLMGCKCFHTGKSNFFTVEIIDDQGQKQNYEMYFTASRSSKKGVINLFIQSAYIRDPDYRSNRPKVNHWAKIGFGIILYNTLNNLPIKPPK